MLIEEILDESENDKSATEIWLADFTFLSVEGYPVVSKNVLCRRIPFKFLMKDNFAYNRAIRPFTITQIKELRTNIKTKQKTFTINYHTYISTVNYKQ